MDTPTKRERSPAVAIGSLKLLSPPAPGQVVHDVVASLTLLSEPYPGQLMTPEEHAEAMERAARYRVTA